MEANNLKILAIDDNLDNLTALKAVVQDLLPGCIVLTALNGTRGIELAAAEDPEVILLDLVMPGLDGVAVCRRLKADEHLRSIPVVFLTALKSDRESRVRALQAGGEGFLSKPPDELELIATIQAMAKVKAANRVQRLEREQLAALVAERTVEIEHNRQATLSLLEDLTDENEARKRTEQSLRETRDYLENLFAHANAAIIVWDPNLKITRFNQAFQTLTGIPAADALGQSLEILFPADSRDCFLDIIRLTSGECWESQEMPVLDRKTGTIRIVLWNSASILGPDGKTLDATIAQGIDITERRHAEDALRKTLRERETLLKEVHHRVKNNLQIITSLMSLQARRDQTPAIVAAFRTMQDRIRSMALLHEALYRSEDLARIDFKPYIERVCRQLAHSLGADATRVKLETRVSPVMLPLDQAVPCGLLINELVTNVFKHAFPDGRQGRATVALEFETERKLVLTVADDGVGLPATLDTKQAKTLGMELVRGLTQQLEGTLSVDRGAPGTVFRVTFPAPLECV